MKDIGEYVRGLPEASGTFTGTYYPEVVDAMMARDLDLMPIEIDASESPYPVTALLTQVTVTIGEQAWTLPIDHVDLMGGNRVRVWCRRPAVEVPGG